MTDREKLIELLVEAENGTTVLSGLSKEQQIRQIMEQIADRLIANGVVISKNETTTQRWIPVTERLPEKGTGSVLVVKQFRGKSYVDIGEVMDGKVYCYSDEHCVAPKEHIFTHWMPLPEMPKEE